MYTRPQMIVEADYLYELDKYARALAWGCYNAQISCLHGMDAYAKHEVYQTMLGYLNAGLTSRESFNANSAAMRIG